MVGLHIPRAPHVFGGDRKVCLQVQTRFFDRRHFEKFFKDRSDHLGYMTESSLRTVLIDRLKIPSSLRTEYYYGPFLDDETDEILGKITPKHLEYDEIEDKEVFRN